MWSSAEQAAWVSALRAAGGLGSEASEGFEEDAWRSLEVAIDAIHDATVVANGETTKNGGSPVPSYETLYRSVEDVCVHKKAPWLFEKLRAKLEGRVRERVRALKASAAAMDPEAFLCAFDTAWQEHCDAVDKTRRVFLYLDRARVGAHHHHHAMERRETSGEPRHAPRVPPPRVGRRRRVISAEKAARGSCTVRL